MLKEFEAISERGGVLGAMETGYQRGKIQEESMYYEHKKHDGSYPIVGVNTFRNPHGDAAPQKVELARSTDDEKQSQLQRLADFHAAARGGGAGGAGEAEAGRDRERQRVRRAGEHRARVLAGADHQRAVRGRRAVPAQHVGAATRRTRDLTTASDDERRGHGPPPSRRRRRRRSSTSAPATPRRRPTRSRTSSRTWSRPRPGATRPTVLTGALLIGLGYWAYNGIRDSIAETRVTSLEALLGTVVTGLDVWVGEHRTEAVRLARDPVVVERATRLAADAQRQPPRRGRCTAEAEDLGRMLQASLSTQGVVAFRIVDRAGLVLASKDPARCGQRLRSAAFRQRLDLAIDGAPQFVRPYPEPELSVKGASGQRRPVALVPRADSRRRRRAGRRAGDGRRSRPRARDDLLRRAPGQHRRGVRVLGRRPACSRRRASPRSWSPPGCCRSRRRRARRS